LPSAAARNGRCHETKQIDTVPYRTVIADSKESEAKQTNEKQKRKRSEANKKNKQ